MTICFGFGRAGSNPVSVACFFFFVFCVFFSHFLASNGDGARPFFVVLDWGRSPKEICNFGVNDLVVFLSDPTLAFDGQYYVRSTLPKSS